MLGSHFRPMPCPSAQECISAGLVFAGMWGTPGLNVVLQFSQGRPVHYLPIYTALVLRL